MVEYLTGDGGVAGSSLTGGTVLCPRVQYKSLALFLFML